MPYWNALGRTIITQEPREYADAVANFLNNEGINATVTVDPESLLCTVTVPSEQEIEAGRLMERYHQTAKPAEERAADYRQEYLEQSPSFIPSEEKFRNSTNSSFAFIISGAVIFFMALIHFFLIIYHLQAGTMTDCILELILGFIFLMFGLSTHQKVRMMKSRIQEENAFNDQLVRWFSDTYSADYLDRIIYAAADESEIAEEELFFLRRQLIHDYILREYNISDTAYLDYITDLIYKKQYVPNGISAAS